MKDRIYENMRQRLRDLNIFASEIFYADFFSNKIYFCIKSCPEQEKRIIIKWAQK